MAAVVRVSGPPEVTVFNRAEPSDAGKNRSRAARETVDLIDTDRGGKSNLIRFFRELR
jgi:hypothetical protein